MMSKNHRHKRVRDNIDRNQNPSTGNRQPLASLYTLWFHAGSTRSVTDTYVPH